MSGHIEANAEVAGSVGVEADMEAAENLSQLDMINAWATEENILHKFNNLPNSRDFVFEKVDARSRHKDKHTHPQKLYLSQNETEQTWAHLKLFNKRPTEVFFVVVAADGTTEVE